MKPRITVITLGVDDLERSVAFYRDGLGLPTEGIIGTEFEHGAVAFLSCRAASGWPCGSAAIWLMTARYPKHRPVRLSFHWPTMQAAGMKWTSLWAKRKKQARSLPYLPAIPFMEGMPVIFRTLTGICGRLPGTLRGSSRSSYSLD